MIGKRVASAVERYMYQNGMGDRIQYLRWEFNLIESKEINAFAMPGGKSPFIPELCQYYKQMLELLLLWGMK